MMNEKLLNSKERAQKEKMESNFFTDNFIISDQRTHQLKSSCISESLTFVVDWQTPILTEE